MINRLLMLTVLVAVVFLVGQLLLDRFGKDNESSRKLVHILHGVTLAALAFIVPLWIIVILEVFFLVSMLIARYLHEHFDQIPWIHYLGKVYRVGRVSYGEFFFPVSVIVTLLIANSKWEFAAAVLILGLADAAAALVGKRYGASSSYNIFGQKKSVIGSSAFLLVTVLILTIFTSFSGSDMAHVSLAMIIGVSLLLTAAENLGVYGSDNFLIPLVAVVLLNHL